MRNLRAVLSAIGLLGLFVLQSCYTFTGATIEGKTIYITPVENRASNIVPVLSPTLTEKIRSRVVSQAGLAPINSQEADYTLSTVIVDYHVSISGVQGSSNSQTPIAQNRLSISIAVEFTNRFNEKSNFKQTFTRFRDYDASELLQQVEARLIDEICTELADDIFNNAFVNW